MTDDQEKLKLRIQELLGEEIAKFILKGKGAVNFAYQVETANGKYIVKQEREDKEFQPQNDLVVEATIIQKLESLNLSLPIPKVVFVSDDPKMYGYKYIEGEILRSVWDSLTEEEKMNICHSLGHFHAEIGKKVTKEMSGASGIKINDSSGLHPEVAKDYDRLILDANIPSEFKSLAMKAKKIFDQTLDKIFFQFLHNDAQHENILIKDKEISGIIDFGEAEYGEVAKEFSRYIRDFPDHFQYIISAYEEETGNKLSHERLVSNALLSGFIDIIEDYRKGGESREKAEKAIEKYKKLLI